MDVMLVLLPRNWGEVEAKPTNRPKFSSSTSGVNPNPMVNRTLGLGNMASVEQREPMTGVWAEHPVESRGRASGWSGVRGRSEAPWSWKLWSICTPKEGPKICCQYAKTIKCGTSS